MTSLDEKSPFLSSDRPCKDPGEDLLGYAPFAKMIAHSVLRGSPADGLVVGVFGEWGLGKTTLLNFIEHFAKADTSDDEPIIVRFNPWWFSGREDLLRRFFKDFESAVLKGRSRNAKLREALHKFGEAVGNVPLAWVASVGKGVAAAAKLGQPADVVALKDAIEQALRAEALRVIVLVDDIDRLLPSEMVDIFRLVRSVGDFPNVHYVLAFDREVVVKALTEECRTEGERYLEKIVQASFELPPPRGTTLQRLFADRLNRVLSGTDDDLVSSSYWNEVFVKGIAPLLRTPRDVTRLINALAVIYPSVRNEVNPVDFVAIETLRLFAPSAYESIRSNQGWFMGPRPSVQRLLEENKFFHDGWLAKVTRSQDAVKATVALLFPAIAKFLAKPVTAGTDASLRKARRICSEQVFDVYFRYSLDPQLSRGAFRASLERSSEELGAELKGFSSETLEDGRTKLHWFLEMLRDELSTHEGGKWRHLLEPLCAVGESLIASAPPTKPFEVRSDALLMFAIEEILATVPITERAAALESSLASAGLNTEVMLVLSLGDQSTRGEEAALPRAALKELEVHAQQRLVEASVDGTLWTAPRLLRLLFDWKRLGGEAQMREAVHKWSADDGNLIIFLGSLKRRSMDGQERIEIDKLSELLDPDQAAEHSKRILEQPALEQRTRDLLRLLLNAYASSEPERNERKAKMRILSGILQETVRTGWFPTMHWVVTTFEPAGPAIRRLTEDELIQEVADARYMITIGGLQQIRTAPFAEGELHACAVLLEEVKAAYHQNDRAIIDLQQVISQHAELRSDLNVLRRAALVLLVYIGGIPQIKVNFDTDGRPLSVSAGQGILDVSL